jgi:hypothetical protein
VRLPLRLLVAARLLPRADAARSLRAPVAGFRGDALRSASSCWRLASASLRLRSASASFRFLSASASCRLRSASASTRRRPLLLFARAWLRLASWPRPRGFSRPRLLRLPSGFGFRRLPLGFRFRFFPFASATASRRLRSASASAPRSASPLPLALGLGFFLRSASASVACARLPSNRCALFWRFAGAPLP